MNQKTMDMLQDHFGRRRRVLASVSWRKGLEVYRSISSDNRDELIFIISNAQLEQLQDVEEVLQRRVQFRSPNWLCLVKQEHYPMREDIGSVGWSWPHLLEILFGKTIAILGNWFSLCNKLPWGWLWYTKIVVFMVIFVPLQFLLSMWAGKTKAFLWEWHWTFGLTHLTLSELSSREVSRFVPPELTLGEDWVPVQTSIP